MDVSIIRRISGMDYSNSMAIGNPLPSLGDTNEQIMVMAWQRMNDYPRIKPGSEPPLE